MSRKLIQIGIVGAALIAGAGCSHAPVAQQVAQTPLSGCGEAYPVADARKAIIVEGFGGPDAQLLVTEQRPRHRCAAPLTQARGEAHLASLP